MSKEKDKSYEEAEKIAEAIIKVFDVYNDSTIGVHLYALRTAIISILHFYSRYDKGGGIEMFLDSLRNEYHKAHAALEQMENAEKDKYN